MDIEIWKDIVGYEGLYQVSNFGNVKSLNYNHRKIEKNLAYAIYDGYYYVGLFKKKLKMFRVHRLIAFEFIPNPENKPYINHKDGNRLNNALDNLEWCTNLENQRHSWAKLGRKNPSGQDNKLSQIIYQKDIQGRVIKKWNGIREAGRKTGVNRLGIARCANGAQRHAGGYLWSYCNDL